MQWKGLGWIYYLAAESTWIPDFTYLHAGSFVSAVMRRFVCLVCCVQHKKGTLIHSLQACFCLSPLLMACYLYSFLFSRFHNVINVYQETRYVAGIYPDLLFYLLFCFLYYAFHAWCNCCNMLMKGFYRHL